MQGRANVEPPTGVIEGHSVMKEERLDDEERMKVDKMISVLKNRHAYGKFSEERLREKAIEILVEAGEID